MSRLKKASLNLALFLAVSLGGGLGTAWYMIEAGSQLSARTFGPWVTWIAAGRPPSAKEKELAVQFLREQPLKEFALALFNLNAFLYVQ